MNTTLADSNVQDEPRLLYSRRFGPDWALRATVYSDGTVEMEGDGKLVRNSVEGWLALFGRFSEASPRWVRTDERKPEDGQRVLGCWRLPPSSRREKFAYESLTYGAADSPIDGPEVWSHWDGEKADEPDYWMPLEALGEPK